MIIRLRPKTKGRPRLGRRRKAYTPKETLEFERIFREAYEELMDHDTITGPVGVTVEFGSHHIEIEVFELEEGLRPKYVQGDLDNYFKAVGDAINKVAYNDDKQIHYMDIRFTKEDK